MLFKNKTPSSDKVLILRIFLEISDNYEGNKFNYGKDDHHNNLLTYQLQHMLIGFCDFITLIGGLHAKTTQWKVSPSAVFKEFERFCQTPNDLYQANSEFKVLKQLLWDSKCGLLYCADGIDKAKAAQKLIAKALLKRDLEDLCQSKDAFDHKGQLTAEGKKQLRKVTARYKDKGLVRKQLPLMNNTYFKTAAIDATITALDTLVAHKDSQDKKSPKKSFSISFGDRELFSFHWE